MDLAHDLIRLSGLEPDVDIKVTFTGVRPGEKLFEELFTDMEKFSSTKHQRIFISNNEVDGAYGNVVATIAKNKNTLNKKDILDLLTQLIPEYQRKTANF